MRNFTKEDLEKEVWKSMFGYEGYCEVSTMGRIKVLQRYSTDKNGKVKNIKEKILILGYYSNGYEQFSISIDNKRHTGIAHRLVAKTFLPNLEEKLEINHINGIKDDNRLCNLEWCTRQENLHHALTKLPKAVHDHKGAKNSNTKLTDVDVLYIREHYTPFINNSKLYEEFSNKISLSSFKQICYGITWKHLL
jgi:hypothetical protein